MQILSSEPLVMQLYACNKLEFASAINTENWNFNLNIYVSVFKMQFHIELFAASWSQLCQACFHLLLYLTGRLTLKISS